MSLNKYYIFKFIQFIVVLSVVIGFQQIFSIQQDLFDVVFMIGTLIVAISIATALLLHWFPHVLGKYISAIIATLVILFCFGPVETLVQDYFLALCINGLIFLLEIYAIILFARGATS